MSASAFNGKNSTEAGFTLVEIAIVLVIIGLLLGGILKGQEMITQAKIKNAINDFNGVTVAVTSYQDRYRALPGDDKGATARWTVQASTTLSRRPLRRPWRNLICSGSICASPDSFRA